MSKEHFEALALARQVQIETLRDECERLKAENREIHAERLKLRVLSDALLLIQERDRSLLKAARDWMDNKHTAPLKSELLREIDEALGGKV